jgi:hypothetical protein
MRMLTTEAQRHREILKFSMAEERMKIGEQALENLGLPEQSSRFSRCLRASVVK